jgi:UDP-N-acetylmuramoylalanine--D-glutamate ligase
MKQAVDVARRLAEPGDTVLLAPACASLDQYKDYQERGRVFVEAVQGLAP